MPTSAAAFFHNSHKFGQVLSKPISGPKNLHTAVRLAKKNIGAYTNVKFCTSSCEVSNTSTSNTWKFTLAIVNKGSPADSFKGSAHQKDPVDLPELTIGNRWHNCQVRMPRFAKEAKIARTGWKLKAPKDPYKQATCLGMPLPSKGFSFQLHALEIPKASDSSLLLKPLRQRFRHTDIVTVTCLLEPEREKVGDMVGY